MPLHIHRELPLTLPLPLISTTSSRPCVRGVPSTHFSSLRQLAEMPSLAGPISRAQLASFTRLDDGAFCRVISASLWAPPTPVATPGQPAAPNKWCSWPFVRSAGTCSAIGRPCAFFPSLSPHRTPVPPIVLDRHAHMAMVRYGLRADDLVRFTHARRANLAKKCPACR